jgi:hypothetical protein
MARHNDGAEWTKPDDWSEPLVVVRPFRKFELPAPCCARVVHAVGPWCRVGPDALGLGLGLASPAPGYQHRHRTRRPGGAQEARQARREADFDVWGRVWGVYYAGSHIGIPTRYSICIL